MFGFGGGAPGGGHGHGGPGVFMKTYKVYSSAFSGKDTEMRGNKIILPSSALEELARLHITYPMTFRIVNPQLKKKTYCGVLEFVAEEGTCYMPYWMMENLLVGEEDEILITSVSLQKGTYVKMRPHKTAFVELYNPKAILETELTHYSTLMEGDTININYQGQDFLIDIVESKPDKQICVVEADLNLDFDTPKDYKEKPKVTKKSTKSAVDDKKIDEMNFDEKYCRIDGKKKLTKKQKRKLFEKMQKEKEDKNYLGLDSLKNYNPREHLLKHGIKNYDERMAKKREEVEKRKKTWKDKAK